MMKRNNNKLAALAIAVTASAIGAGAVVSGNAMAGSDPVETDTATISVVSVGATAGPDGAEGFGEPVACTFEGVDLSAFSEAVPAEEIEAVGGSGVVTAVGEVDLSDMVEEVVDGQVVQWIPANEDGAVGGGYEIEVDASGVVVGEAPVAVTPDSATPTEGGVSAETGAVAVGELPEGMQVITADQARQGTPTECTAMLADLIAAP